MVRAYFGHDSRFRPRMSTTASDRYTVQIIGYSRCACIAGGTRGDDDQRSHQTIDRGYFETLRRHLHFARGGMPRLERRVRLFGGWGQRAFGSRSPRKLYVDQGSFRLRRIGNGDRDAPAWSSSLRKSPGRTPWGYFRWTGHCRLTGESACLKIGR